MSRRIPIGWTPVVAGEKIPVASVIEVRKDPDYYGDFIRNTNPVLEWGESRHGSIYRIVEQEPPQLEYPTEPVLTEEEARQLAICVAYRVCDGWSYRGDVADLKRVVREEALKITREVSR